MAIFGPLSHSWKKNEFSQKKIGLSVFIFYNYLTIMQKSKNTNEQTAKKHPLKLTDRQSDKQSDRQREMQTETEPQTDR